MSSAPRSRLVAPFAAALVLASLTACSGSATAETESTDATRAVQTAYGEVEVPAEPQRVVAVSYDTPWQLAAVGVTPVAMQDYSAYADSFTADQQELISSVDTVGAFFDLNIEAVLAAEPDLIVGDVLEIDEATFEELSKIAPTAIFEGEYRGDWRAIGGSVADAVNEGDAFESAEEAYDEDLARVKEEYADVLARPWAAIGDGDVEGGFSVLYPGGSVGALFFDDLGAALAPSIPAEDGDKGWSYVSPELTTSVLGGAEIIVTGADPQGELSESLAGTVETPLFTDLPAARSGSVYGIWSSVTDYGTALAWLDSVEETVLVPESAS
ncbi:ABC transporter substrate-binding protein [Rathayibacter sp. VKM Ac-2803]|uniref:ABC transporter substrate-binding protein n=1 Tax=Rathayibacter sp. VKM Ac-2803 TaxID=2609256 RepID=UPI001359CEB7|nr:ABC transporter substrate-binding protein [Rathayibacter sp. VKM Ac-2803]MWV50716.1 ABC transporter substrate-binding protein [Rathayibacter sp. VKM Ac-2803]